MGDGTFSPVPFTPIEIYAYHFATAPGTFGKDRAPAFADAFLMNDRRTRGRPGDRHHDLRAPRTATGRGTGSGAKKDGKTHQYALAMGDLDGDGLDDVVFADSERRTPADPLPAAGRIFRRDGGE